MKKAIYILVFQIQLACVEPYLTAYPTNQTIISVEATFSNEENEQYITIQKSMPQINKKAVYAVTNAKVKLIINKTEIINLVEKGTDGHYYFPLSSKPIPKNSYRLQIQTEEGAIIESDEEMIESSTKFDSLKVEFDPEGYSYGTRIDEKYGTHKFYIDFKDPAGIPNNYVWYWRIFEKTDVCLSCLEGNIVYLNNEWQCVKSINKSNEFSDGSDVQCEKDCWNIYFQEGFYTSNDLLFDGQNVKNRLIAVVPYMQKQGCLVEFYHQNVTVNGLKYLKLITQQAYERGSLTDPPPAALIGNLRCINDSNLKVAGAFIVFNTFKRRYWLDRKDAIQSKAKFIGIPFFRRVKFKEDIPFAPPMKAPCKNSKFRTNLKPSGWQI